MAEIPAAENRVPEEALTPIADPRCFLWEANGRPAATVTLPPGATVFPPAFAISTLTAPFIWRRYSPRPGAAKNMYVVDVTTKFSPEGVMQIIHETDAEKNARIEQPPEQPKQPEQPVPTNINIRTWLLAAVLTVVVAAGDWMASPKDGMHSAGFVLIIAGLFGVIELMRKHLPRQ